MVNICPHRFTSKRMCFHHNQRHLKEMIYDLVLLSNMKLIACKDEESLTKVHNAVVSMGVQTPFFSQHFCPPTVCVSVFDILPSYI